MLYKRLQQTKALVMGILNTTPDSFYDGGMHATLEEAVKYAGVMIAEGADIIDVGGESTRPGSSPVSLDEEKQRVIPVIKALINAHPEIRSGKVLLSVDTYKAAVAGEALDAGAGIINDISGFRFDRGMVTLAARWDVPVIVMHMQGDPGHMQANPFYEDVVSDVTEFFNERISFLTKHSVRKENIILDPGIGFGKTTKHNIEILSHMKEFKKLGCPVLIGASRKSFIGRILGGEDTPVPPSMRLEGSVAVGVWSVLNGADILRVHDVKETRDALQVVGMITDKNLIKAGAV